MADQCTAVSAVVQQKAFDWSSASYGFLYGLVVGILLMAVLGCMCCMYGGQRRSAGINKTSQAQTTYTALRDVAAPRFVPLPNLEEVGGAA
jgi:hypothetical protein